MRSPTGCVFCLLLTVFAVNVAEAAPNDTSAPDLQRLPSNPALEAPAPGAPRTPELSFLPKSPIELRVSGGWVYRPAEDASRVEYSSGPVFSAVAAVSLLDWLAIGVYAGGELHKAQLAQDALGLGASANDVQLTGLRFGSFIEPKISLTAKVDLWFGVGLGWARFTAERLDLVAAPGGAVTLPERAGVLLEFPLTIGASFRPFGDAFAASASFGFAPTTGQSGALFNAGAGRRQAVSQTDGKILTLAGFPKFGHALSFQLSVDYSL